MNNRPWETHTAERECCVEGTFPEIDECCPCLCRCLCHRWWPSLRWEWTCRLRWTLKNDTDTQTRGVKHSASVLHSDTTASVALLLDWIFLCDLHGGGLPSPIMAKKSSYLAFIKVDAKAIYGWSTATAKHFDQVLDTDTLHQVSWFCFKEWLGYTQQNSNQILYVLLCLDCNYLKK